MRKKHKKREIGSCIFLLYRVTKLNKNVLISIHLKKVKWKKIQKKIQCNTIYKALKSKEYHMLLMYICVCTKC